MEKKNLVLVSLLAATVYLLIFRSPTHVEHDDLFQLAPLSPQPSASEHQERVDEGLNIILPPISRKPQRQSGRKDHNRTVSSGPSSASNSWYCKVGRKSRPSSSSSSSSSTSYRSNRRHPNSSGGLVEEHVLRLALNTTFAKFVSLVPTFDEDSFSAAKHYFKTLDSGRPTYDAIAPLSTFANHVTMQDCVYPFLAQTVKPGPVLIRLGIDKSRRAHGWLQMAWACCGRLGLSAGACANDDMDDVPSWLRE